MMRLIDLEDEKDYLKLTRLDRLKIKILTCPDWYDGPISGLLMYNQKKYWYQRIDEASDEELENNQPFYRRYIIIELSQSQLNEEEYWEKLFREKVSDNPKYDDSGSLVYVAVQPTEIWDEFYTAYNKKHPPDFSKNTVIGWFE